MAFDPSQPRADTGMWTATGSASSDKVAQSKAAADAQNKANAKTSAASARAAAKARADAAKAAKAKAAADKAAAKAGKGKHAPGTARNADAAKAQAADGAQGLYDQLMDTPAGKRGAYAKGLSDGDLEKAVGIAYSSKTSDANVVAARVALANEAARRGIDIRKYGALGGGKAAPTKPTPAQVKAVAQVKAKAKAAPVKAKPKAVPTKPAAKHQEAPASAGGTLRARAI